MLIFEIHIIADENILAHLTPRRRCRKGRRDFEPGRNRAIRCSTRLETLRSSGSFINYAETHRTMRSIGYMPSQGAS